MKKFRSLKLVLIALSTIYVSACNIQIVPPSQNGLITNVSIQSSIGDEPFLEPNGKSKFEWNLKITDKDGNPIPNIPLTLSVVPISPSAEWRKVDNLAKQYEGTQSKFREQVKTGVIRLLGTIEPTSGITDKDGIIKVMYTASNVGSNTEKPAQEKVVASFGSMFVEKVFSLGYASFVPVPLVEGGLRISEATGVYVNPDFANLLQQIGERIQKQSWSQPMTVTAGNLRWGGLYPPHFTHRTGNEIDFRPMSVDGKPTWCNANGSGANYDREKTLELIKIFRDAGADEIYFNDPKSFEFGAKPLSGHHHHVHISWSKKLAKKSF